MTLTMLDKITDPWPLEHLAISFKLQDRVRKSSAVISSFIYLCSK